MECDGFLGLEFPFLGDENVLHNIENVLNINGKFQVMYNLTTIKKKGKGIAHVSLNIPPPCMLWLELQLPEGYAFECGLTWKWGLCGCNQVKMKSLGWAFSPS